MAEERFIFKRKEAVEYLVERDGYQCQYPGCDLPFDEGKHCLTIDHIYPQALAKEEGWTFEEIWALDNLQLMGKSCNARKSNHLYDEDGNLPVRERLKIDKSLRQAVCNLCMSGRLLLEDEFCELCGSEAQPKAAPAYLQKRPPECSHGERENDHCWMCWTGLVKRKSALESIIRGP